MSFMGCRKDVEAHTLSKWDGYSAEDIAAALRGAYDER